MSPSAAVRPPLSHLAAAVAVGLLLSGCALPKWSAPSAAPLANLLPSGDTKSPPMKTGELSARESAEACRNAAKQLETHGREAEAIVLYERARNFAPDLPGVAWRLAVLYDRTQQVEKARREYAAALDESPDDPRLLNDFAFFHYERGRYSEAEAAFRDLLRRDPKNERAAVNLGLTLAAQQRYDEAIGAFSLVLSPAAAHSNLGVLLAQQGRLDEAKAAFRQALALEPTLREPGALLAHLESRPVTLAGPPGTGALPTAPAGAAAVEPAIAAVPGERATPAVAAAPWPPAQPAPNP